MIALVAVAALVAREDASLPGGLPAVPTPPDARNDREATPLPDPFAYDEDRKEEFEERAAAGNAHVLYARSPGGAGATASGWRAGARRSRRPPRRPTSTPDQLEALVFLESAGREDAMAGNTEGAVGLTQILAETGQNLLGMRVDVAAQPPLHAPHPARAAARPAARGAAPARARGAGSTSASTPPRRWPAPRATCKLAKARFHREDLAFVSYHMGMGNLESVLRAYGTEPGDEDVSYTQVYFDSTPQRNAAAQRKLASFGDDSSNYLWKLGAAREIMRLHRKDAGELARLQAAQTRQELGRGGAAPAGLDDALHDARDAAGGVGRRGRSWPSPTTRA